MKRTICYILLVILVAVLFYAGRNYFGLREEYEEGRDSYANLEQYVSMVPPTTQAFRENSGFEAEENSIHIENAIPTEYSPPITVDFDSLRQINSDIVGWLYIEGTTIHYPIVQGEDNEYYLKHLFDGSYHFSGSVFLDANGEPDFSGRNNIVYGHSMGDGSMFCDVGKYKEQAYFDAHPKGVLLTPDKAYEVEFFSAYTSDTLGEAWDMEFSQEGYGEWLRDITEKSVVDSQVQPKESDCILTLSTCSYAFTEARFVLHGRIAEVDSLS